MTYIGYQSTRESPINLESWYIKHWMINLHHIYQSFYLSTSLHAVSDQQTKHCSLNLAATQPGVIEPSPSPDQSCGIAFPNLSGEQTPNQLLSPIWRPICSPLHHHRKNNYFTTEFLDWMMTHSTDWDIEICETLFWVIKRHERPAEAETGAIQEVIIIRKRPRRKGWGWENTPVKGSAWKGIRPPHSPL